MPRLLAVVLAVLAALPVSAQDFPPPGTGVFTWERVGDRPLDAESFSFTPDGRLYTARDTVFVLDPAAPPAGRWQALGYPTGFTDALLALDAGGDTLLVANGNGGRITRSTDSGATWAVVHGEGPGIGGPNTPDGFFVVPPGHPHAGRLLAGGVVLFSDDRGATWHDAAQDIPTNQQSSAQTFAVLPSGRTLAGTGGGVLGSDDGGESYLRTPLWGPYATYALVPLATPGSGQSGAPACGLASPRSGGEDPALCDGAVAVGFSTALPHARAWRTADGGRTWSESVPLPEPYDGVANGYTAGVVALSPGPDGLGRAVTVLGRGVVYATADAGQTWAAVGRMPIRLGGASHYTRLVRLGPDGHLWVSTTINGTQREWLYRSAEPAAAAFPVAGEASPTPSGARLDVRPNPADGRVAVRLSLDAPTPRATATVYDALGRRVAVLHDGPLAAGTHDFALSASRLAPGVYVVQVRVAPEGGAAVWTEVRRVTVAR